MGMPLPPLSPRVARPAQCLVCATPCATCLPAPVRAVDARELRRGLGEALFHMLREADMRGPIMAAGAADQSARPRDGESSGETRPVEMQSPSAGEWRMNDSSQGPVVAACVDGPAN
jgi:hypothetical protein